MLVNKSAIIDEKTIDANGEYYNKLRFTDEEWAEIESAYYGSQGQQQMQERRLPVFSLSSKSQPNQNNSSQTGLIITLSMGSALLIGSVVIVKKLLNKKVKKVK